jgi:protein-S-isoprenylcysteine O-methyltransferase Ste14
MPPEVIAVMGVCYASLLFELAVLRVPSVASSLQLLSPRAIVVAGYSESYRALFAWGTGAKLAAFVAPLGVVYAVFLHPWAAAAAGGSPLGDDMFVPTGATDAFAIALLVAGRAVSLSAALTVRRGNRQRGASFALHTDGLFRWSRNPGLVGMYVFALGLWAAAPSACMLAGIAVYVLHMHFRIRMEEDFLSNKFGAAYAQYLRRTGRYLP